MAISRLERQSPPAAIALCGANWLVPGLGYLLCRDYARGIALLIAINGCFLIGVLMGGVILRPPSWMPRSPEFNLVMVLTYLSQMFHGGGWLLLQWLQQAAASDTDATFNIIRQGAKTYADLGAFHLVVAGSLNYFATVRLYDLLAGTPELSEKPSVTREREAVERGGAESA